MSFWRVQVLMITSFTGCNTDANELNIFFSLSLILINISFPQYPIKNFFDEVRLLKREEVKVRQFLRTICQISNINTKRFEIHIKNLINIFNGSPCCNRQHHCQNIHPTEKFILMNLYKNIYI